MAKLADTINGNGGLSSDVRDALPDEVGGLPTLDLSDMQGSGIPPDYEIQEVLGDILMCEIADENDNGEINRGGIWVKQEVSAKLWRVAKVVKTGPQCSGVVKAGDHVMYPSDKGLPMIQHHKKYIFLNEQRIFCTCNLTK